MRIIYFHCVDKEGVKGGYSVLCQELGVASQGETIKKAKKNIIKAVNRPVDRKSCKDF